MSSLPEKEAHPHKAALDAALRASTRSATVVHREMKRGLNSLATIASIAPWMGLLGTVLGLMNSFSGVHGSKETIMAVFFSNASQAFVPTALGLIVALPALCSYKHLSAELESFTVEMEGASHQLRNGLAIYLGRRNS
jgi:biopolymer transport protein ExbB/biopolymer transport protein TolQ